MKKFLLWSMMMLCAGVFASDSINEIQERKNKIEQLAAEQRELEKKQQADAATIAQEIRKEQAVLYEIKEKERLEKQYGQNKKHAQAIQAALTFAEKSKKNPYKYVYEGEMNVFASCTCSGTFIAETAHQKLAAHRLIDAIEGKDNQVENFSCKTDFTICVKGLICGFFAYPFEECYTGQPDNLCCCGEFTERRDATYLREGAILLAQEKLQELAVRQEKVEEQLDPVAQQVVRSEIIADPVQSLIMDREVFSASEEKSE